MLALAPNVAAAIQVNHFTYNGIDCGSATHNKPISSLYEIVLFVQEVGRPAAGNLAAEMATAIAQDTGVATVKIMKQQENALVTEIRNAVVASTVRQFCVKSCLPYTQIHIFYVGRVQTRFKPTQTHAHPVSFSTYVV